MVDFSSYLQEILNDESLEELAICYTPTQLREKKRSKPEDGKLFRLRLKVEKIPEKSSDSQEQALDVLDGLRKYAESHVLLIGRPGSGKSTSLERLFWEEAQAALVHDNRKIPVLVRLRRYKSSIEDLIRDQFANYGLTITKDEITKCLNNGIFLLMLDGLNEVSDDNYQTIIDFRRRYRRTTSMIMTVRDLDIAIVSDLGVSTRLEMLPLTQEQMKDFVLGYLGNQGIQIWDNIYSDYWLKFAKTPLLLWMLCRVFTQNGILPKNLGGAFQEFTQLYDRELKADVSTYEKSRSWWSNLLQELAFSMMCGETSSTFRLEISQQEAEDILTGFLTQEKFEKPRHYAKQWLEDLLNHHLIQRVDYPNRASKVEFHHQLIQEYYAAEWLSRRLVKLNDEELKGHYLNYLKWTESIRLMLNFLDDKVQQLRLIELAFQIDLKFGIELIYAIGNNFHDEAITYLETSAIPANLSAKLLNHLNPEGRRDRAGYLTVANSLEAGLPSGLNKVVILNLALVLTHQVDGAYWHEWEMFQLPGGIQLNNFINLITFVVLIYLFIPVVQRKASGITCSLVIAAISALVLPTHVGFAIVGYQQFHLPFSIFIIVGTFLLSILQVVLTHQARIEFGDT